MSVKSTTFGSVRLSGEDAKKFSNQVRYGRPKKEAVAAYRRGQEKAREFSETGVVKFSFAK